MDDTTLMVLGPIWLTLGATALVAGLRARRRPRWLSIGRWALALLFVPAGALANAVLLATGADYAGFADGSAFAFVTDTWRTLVAPNQGLFIGALIVFEAAIGVLVVSRRLVQPAMIAMIGFHVALIAFGWGFLLWSGPMLVALVGLLRAQRATATAMAPTTVAGPRPSARDRRLG